MTRTTILALQSMGFGNEKSMTLSLSLFLSEGGTQLLPQVIKKP